MLCVWAAKTIVPYHLHPNRAFKTLAYRRFHHVPLYLEWAPRDIFSRAPAPAPALSVPAVAPKGGAVAVTGLAAAEAADPCMESCTLYVKNLSWETGAWALMYRHVWAGPP